MNEVKELLIKAKAKIDSPEKWTKGTWARDEDGFHIDERNSKACKFCSLGAMFSVDDNSIRVNEAASLLPEIEGSPIKWNDDPNRTHAEVMQAFDEAIANA